MVNLNMARKSEKVKFSNSGLWMDDGGGGDQSDVSWSPQPLGLEQYEQFDV